jgi:hypothetical protein
MTTKIINYTNLSYQEIGLIIDEINKKIETNYVGKKSYCLFKFRGNTYNVETEIMKSCFKVILKEFENE